MNNIINNLVIFSYRSFLFNRHTAFSCLLRNKLDFFPGQSVALSSALANMTNITVSKKNPSPVVSLVVEHLKCQNLEINLTEGDRLQLKVNNELISGEGAVCRHLARTFPQVGLYGISPLDQSQIDSWLDFSNLHLKNSSNIEVALKELNQYLAPASLLVGHTLTLADFSVWAALKGNSRWNSLYESGSVETHVARWFKYCSGQKPFTQVETEVKGKVNQEKTSNPKDGKKLKASMEEGGKFFDLPGAEKGNVCVRFPPEASGYLHIGHAKAALLNQYYKDHYEGKLVFRFDDTNPSKENAHFEEIILEDIKLLQLTPDRHTRTSDYFEQMFEYAEQLIKQGDAYCDNSSAEEMKKQREERAPSPYRDTAVEKNLETFNEMKKGTSTGFTFALRAKMDYKSDNGCLRDPVLYRCRDEEHLIHGNKYKAYPTYDFACPIVDSIEGVTHALRTTEYLDRDDQFYWIIEKLGIRKPHIYSYSRLNLINTVLSKRKLTYLVDEGYVEGWNDPRFPTVRGVLRRGMTLDGLKEFIIAQGSSKSNVHMEWDKIWAFNKKVIDPIAPRYNALSKKDVVPVHVVDAKPSSAIYPKHPKNAEVGQKEVYYSSRAFVEGEDAQTMKEGDLVTFINWGNIRISKVNRTGDKVSSLVAVPELDNKDFKNTLKITWLAQHNNAPFIPTVCSFFDNIIDKADLSSEDDFKDHICKNTKHDSEMMGDPGLASLKKGDIIQLQRRGYFICDEPYVPASRHSGRESSCILFHIPDGSSAGMMNQGKDKTKKSGSSKDPTGASKKQQKQSNQKKETTAAPATLSVQDEALHNEIVVQGDKIRNLKSAEADKAVITAEVEQLKTLKAKFKEATGREYTPPFTNAPKPIAAASSAPSGDQQVLYNQIASQGDKIRSLKSAKADKNTITAEVEVLKTLKAQYKEASGVEYTHPPVVATAVANKNNSNNNPSKKTKKVMSPTPTTPSAEAPLSAEAEGVKEKIVLQGEKIRQLKSDKAPQDQLKPEIDDLLKLKASFKELTGSDYQAPGAKPKRSKDKKEKPVQQPKQQAKQQPQKQDDGKKTTRLGLEAKKEDALSDWYSQVITKSELIEYYDVSGCYILRPWAYGIWEKIVEFFDAKIKNIGVENCYFPMFVSQSALQKEKDHIADFAPEVAWVTKSGNTDLVEPIAIRPTSETVMYPSYAKWIQSHRDLPLRLNQWCNVVRWEFKHPQPFLRTREFLWQEGHTAFATRPEAEEEVYQILDFYSQVYSDLLAIPVVKGKKTEKEKFAGGDFTTTCEAYIAASGRAIQGATSHHLGQNFSKMFNIVFEDPNNPDSKEKLFVHQNSWGITTRTIGVLVMVHGDNKGLVLPPRVAKIQVVMVPVGVTDANRDKVTKATNEYKEIFSKAGIRIKIDDRDKYTAGWKFNHWELKGVPIRIEIGPRDIEKDEFVAVRRDTGDKMPLKKDGCVEHLLQLLETIQSNMFDRASKQLSDNLAVATSWETFNSYLDQQKIIQAPFCGEPSCEDKIKKDSAREESSEAGAPSMGAKGLCIPFEQPAEITTEKCIYPGCCQQAKYYTLFGRSY